MTSKTIGELLKETPILSILPPKRTLVALTSSQTIAQCLDVLTQNKLSCAPVRDATSGETLGFLDVLDLTRHVVDVASAGSDIAHDKIDDALERANRFLH